MNVLSQKLHPSLPSTDSRPLEVLKTINVALKQAKYDVAATANLENTYRRICQSHPEIVQEWWTQSPSEHTIGLYCMALEQGAIRFENFQAAQLIEACACQLELSLCDPRPILRDMLALCRHFPLTLLSCSDSRACLYNARLKMATVIPAFDEIVPDADIEFHYIGVLSILNILCGQPNQSLLASPLCLSLVRLTVLKQTECPLDIFDPSTLTIKDLEYLARLIRASPVAMKPEWLLPRLAEAYKSRAGDIAFERLTARVVQALCISHDQLLSDWPLPKIGSTTRQCLSHDAADWQRRYEEVEATGLFHCLDSEATRSDIFMIVLLGACSREGKAAEKRSPLLTKLTQYLHKFDRRDFRLLLRLLCESIYLSGDDYLLDIYNPGHLFDIVYPPTHFDRALWLKRLLTFADRIVRGVLLPVAGSWQAPLEEKEFIEQALTELVVRLPFSVAVPALSNESHCGIIPIDPFDHRKASLEGLVIFARLHRRLGSNCLALPTLGDPIWAKGFEKATQLICSDWTAKGNLKTNKKRMLASDLDTATKIVKELIEHELNATSGMFVIIAGEKCPMAMAFDIDLLCNIIMDGHDAPLRHSLLMLMVSERRLNLPFRCRFEEQLTRSLLVAGIETDHTSDQRSQLIAGFKRLIERHSDVWNRYLKCTDVSDEVVDIVQGLARRIFELLGQYIQISYSHKYKAVALRCIFEACIVLEPDILRPLLQPHLSSLVNCLCSDWDDVRSLSQSIIAANFNIHDLLGESRIATAEQFTDWFLLYIKSPKLRDSQAAIAWFTYLTNGIVSSTIDESIVQHCFQAFGSTLIREDVGLPLQWTRCIHKWLLEQVDSQFVPPVHGALVCLSITLTHLETVPDDLGREIYTGVVKKCVDRFLSFIALGENKVLLSQVQLGRAEDVDEPDEADLFRLLSQTKLRVDCRGHIVLAEENETEDQNVRSSTDNINETLTIPHPSSFSRFWLTIKAAGDLVAELLSKLDLHSDIYAEVVEKCCEILLRSRHPGLLEKWSRALTVGILRCGSDKEAIGRNSTLPARLMIKVMNSLMPAAFYKLYNQREAPAHLGWPDLIDKCHTLSPRLRDATIGRDQTFFGTTGADVNSATFSIVPPPLRKSTSVCAVFYALFHNDFFTKPRSQVIYEHRADGSVAPLCHVAVATAIVSRLLLLCDLSESKMSEEETNCIVSSKFHALNILRVALNQKCTMITLAGRELGLVETNWSCLDNSSFIADRLLDAVLVTLATSSDFRLQNASNLTFVALSNYLADSSRICTEAIDSSTDFQLPSISRIVDRASKPYARNLDNLFLRNPALLYRFLHSGDDLRLLSFLSLHRHCSFRPYLAQSSLVAHHDRRWGFSPKGLCQGWQPLYLRRVLDGQKHPNYLLRNLYKSLAIQMLGRDDNIFSASAPDFVKLRHWISIDPQVAQTTLGEMIAALQRAEGRYPLHQTEILMCIDKILRQDYSISTIEYFSGALASVDNLQGMPLIILLKLRLQLALSHPLGLDILPELIEKGANHRFSQELLQHAVSCLSSESLNHGFIPPYLTPAKSARLDELVRSAADVSVWTSYWRFIINERSPSNLQIDLEAWRHLLKASIYDAIEECRASFSLLCLRRELDEPLLDTVLSYCHISKPVLTRIIGTKILNEYLDRPTSCDDVDCALALLHIFADEDVAEACTLYKPGRLLETRLAAIRHFLKARLTLEKLQCLLRRLPEALVSLANTLEDSLASFGYVEDDNFVVNPDSAFEDEFANCDHLDMLLINEIFDLYGSMRPNHEIRVSDFKEPTSQSEQSTSDNAGLEVVDIVSNSTTQTCSSLKRTLYLITNPLLKVSILKSDYLAPTLLYLSRCSELLPSV